MEPSRRVTSRHDAGEEDHGGEEPPRSMVALGWHPSDGIATPAGYSVNVTTGVSERYGAVLFPRKSLPRGTGASTPLRRGGVQSGVHSCSSALSTTACASETRQVLPLSRRARIRRAYFKGEDRPRKHDPRLSAVLARALRGAPPKYAGRRACLPPRPGWRDHAVEFEADEVTQFGRPLRSEPRDSATPIRRFL